MIFHENEIIDTANIHLFEIFASEETHLFEIFLREFHTKKTPPEKTSGRRVGLIILGLIL